jgi:hypothetical protein
MARRSSVERCHLNLVCWTSELERGALSKIGLPTYPKTVGAPAGDEKQYGCEQCFHRRSPGEGNLEIPVW